MHNIAAEPTKFYSEELNRKWYNWEITEDLRNEQVEEKHREGYAVLWQRN